MNIQVAVLCDAATDDNGKLNFLGAFDTIYARELPATHPQCAVALRVTFLSGDEGKRQMKLNFVGPLWQMQRQQLVLNSTMAALQQINALVQMQLSAGQPGDVLDNFDLSQYARDIGISYDMAKDVIRNMVDVDRIRQGRAAGAQQQAQLQQKETMSRVDLDRARAVAANAKGAMVQGAAQPMALPAPATMGSALG